MGPGVAPELRKLLESIEAWPGNVAQVRQQAERAMGKVQKKEVEPTVVLDDPDLVDPVGADDDEQDALDEHMAATRRYVEPPRKCMLSSSLRAPRTRHLSSMVSAVPQRDQEWRRSALGPELGPGAYSVERARPGLILAEPERQSKIFRSTLPQRPTLLGVTGEPPAPDSMYAHTIQPAKPAGKLPSGASTFNSLSYRFGVDEHIKGVVRRQQAKVPRREIHYWHGAPSWEGPFKPMNSAPTDGEPAQTVVMPPGPDHAERLAAARASVLKPAAVPAALTDADVPS